MPLIDDEKLKNVLQQKDQLNQNGPVAVLHLQGKTWQAFGERIVFFTDAQLSTLSTEQLMQLTDEQLDILIKQNKMTTTLYNHLPSWHQTYCRLHGFSPA